MKLVLASGSPRRRELLARLGVDFDVVVSGVDETPKSGERPLTLVRRLAASKALGVAAASAGRVVLAADTIVLHRGTVLNKPDSAEQARDMLLRLRGPWHRVITAVALAIPGGTRPRIRHVVSRVRLREYEEDEIEESIARGDPFDKAGAYAIQDELLHPVASYVGCHCNVVGLPLWTTGRMLGKVGFRAQFHSLPGVCESCPERTGFMP